MNTPPPRDEVNFSQSLTNVTEKNLNSFLLLPAILCSSIQFLGIAGNVLVIHAIFTQRRFQTNYYHLVCHLAVSDLIVLLSYFEWTLNLWVPSLSLLPTSAMCKLFITVQVVFYSSGVMFLVAIGLVRYRGIVHPFKVKFTRGQLRRAVMAIYLASFLVTTPYSLSFENKNNRCVLTPERHFYNVVVTLVIFLVNFVVPVVLLHVLYLAIIYKLWVQQQTFIGIQLPTPRAASPSNSTRCSNEVQAKQRRFSRAIFVSFVIVVLFSLSSGPHEILWVVAVLGKVGNEKASTLAFLLKLFGTCAVNAFIYGAADIGLKQSFRKTFRKTFRRIMKCCKR